MNHALVRAEIEPLLCDIAESIFLDVQNSCD